MISTVMSSFNNFKDNASKRIQRNRDIFETKRKLVSKRLQGDVKQIAAEELEFSKTIFKRMFPIEISIDKNAKGVRKLIPVNFSMVEFDEWENDVQGPTSDLRDKPSSSSTSSQSKISDAFLDDADDVGM